MFHTGEESLNVEQSMDQKCWKQKRNVSLFLPSPDPQNRELFIMVTV